MNSSVVLNVLYGYFDVKKNKLKWTGSLEDLKAFVLTVIDEETAETTTWRSPSSGKWVFESKPLVVTWQTKSQNIYFEGEKSTALEEQVKAHIESKLESGNAELMSDSEQQQQSVEDSTLSSRGEPDTSVSSDIHIKENDVGRRESNETFWASNNEKYIANEAVIDQDLKRDEDHSHKECSTYANLLGRPSTFDKPQIAETKDSFNSRGSVNNAYTNFSMYDPEIIMLKSKFEKFTDNVVTRLDELAFEINVVKENKPYSIVTLEGVIDDLKKEKAELCRKNEALRESNNNMQQTISQLSQTNKQLEEEKSSLVTAIKIIQNDFNQLAISKKKSGKAREETGGNGDNTWEKCKSKHQSKRPTSLLSNSGEHSKRKTGGIKLKNQYEILTDKNPEFSSSSSDIESDEEPNDKFKSSTKGTHVRRQKKKLIENVKADKTKKNNDAGADKKTTTVIVGDSMVKYLNANRLKRSMPTGNHNIHVETYRGSTTEAMAHHIRPCLVKQPDQIVLHVGTNDVRDKQPEEIVDGIMKIQKIIKKESPKTTVIVSELLHRNDKIEYTQKVKKVNIMLAKACKQHNCDYIEHKNIEDKHLNPYGLHLNRFGTSVMAKNLVNYFNTKYA